MRIQVLSDLHREVEPRRAQADVVDLGADLVILAGDIDQGGAGVRWAAATWPDTPVVYVTGNHEHYGLRAARYGPGDTPMHAASSMPDHMHLLEREAVVIGGTRFVGCTLWTDFQLLGQPDRDRERALAQMADYVRMPPVRGADRLIPWHLVGIHRASVAWLDQSLSQPHDGPTVVVTHHAPSPRSVLQWDEWAGPPPYRDLDAAYATDLGWLIERHQPTAWIHGHTHRSCDYRVGDTRILSNQRGYYGERTGWDPGLVLEVET